MALIKELKCMINKNKLFSIAFLIALVFMLMSVYAFGQFIGSKYPTSAAHFRINPTEGPVPLTVQFTDKSTGSPTSWYWDFGDGTTSTLQNPVHSYNTAGTYIPILTASNVIGTSTKTSTVPITVT
jgi:PKD repeat protein